MTTGRTDHTPSTLEPKAVVSGIRPEELQFAQATMMSAGVEKSNPRGADIMSAVEQIMGARGIATHALGFSATAAAATALLASGVSPTIAGTAALAGVAASVLGPSGKGNGRA